MKYIIETGEDNDVLRQVAKEIKKVDKEIVKLGRDMAVVMEENSGIGLAAPQIGRSIRLIVCKFNHGTKKEKIVAMVNPVIVSRSVEMQVGEEGCLSVPGVYDNVERSSSIVVKYLDEKGREAMLKLADLNAVIVQHEIDHLDGILFTDKVIESAEAVLRGQKL